MEILEIINKYSGIVAIFVYLILLLIIVAINKAIKKNKVSDDKLEKNIIKDDIDNKYPLNLEDEDAIVACLVASIDYRNEHHKNVKVISVREV